MTSRNFELLASRVEIQPTSQHVWPCELRYRAAPGLARQEFRKAHSCVQSRGRPNVAAFAANP